MASLRHLFCFSLLLLSMAAPAAQRMNDTGQTTCYNVSASTGTVGSVTADPEAAGFNEQDCTRGAAAADGLGRMVKIGGSSVPGRDYTKIANDGSVLGASATLGTGPTDWACTRDNITGLICEIKTDDGGLRDKDHSYTWYDTNSAINGGNAGTQAGTACVSTLPNCNTTAFRDAVNALTGSDRLCGATDWRLPTANELSGLANAGAASGLSIDSDWFPNTFSYRHWSGESYAPSASFAWSVDNSMSINAVRKSDIFGRVRLVRGGQ